MSSLNDSEIRQEITVFKDLTHQLNNYNEIFNLNMYLQKLGSTESTRLTKINETLKSKILGYKQEFLMLERDTEYMKLKNNLLYLSAVVICIIMILTGLYLKQKLSLVIASIVSGVIATLYVMYAVLLVKSNSQRRILFWDQYYWPDIKPSI